jgi:hypothetical protein
MTTDINDLYQPIKLFETSGCQVVVTRGTKVYHPSRWNGETFAGFCDVLTGDAEGDSKPDPCACAAEVAKTYTHIATYHTDACKLEIRGIPGNAGVDFLGNPARYDFAERLTHTPEEAEKVAEIRAKVAG